jgi:tetratricopeptide (TPR) repeat protein
MINIGRMKMRNIYICYIAIFLSIIATCSCDTPRDKRIMVISQIYDAAYEANKQQKYNLAEGMYIRALDASKQEGIGDADGYDSLSDIYRKQGKYNQALEATRKRYQIGKTGMDSCDISRYYCHLGDIYLAQGQYNCVMNNLEQALKYAHEAETKQQQSGFTVINFNPSLANYYLELGNYEKARQYRQETLSYFIMKGLSRGDFDGRAKNELARTYYYAGDEHTAENLLRAAGGKNANAFITFPEDLVKSLTMLGRIEEHHGAADKALEAYQSGRDALHMYPTVVYKMEEADVLNLIGRFYVKQGKPEEAAKAYHEAIALRQETATQTHPNCADAIKGLADVAAMRNELTSATLQAAQALKILDTALVPTHPRIAPTLVALASIDALAGKNEEAAPLNARLETILQKPLGPWKEDLLETTSFYAGLLKKAGKSAEAGKLEQIAARQKDKR